MNNKTLEVIEKIVRNGLCTGCGTCVGICLKDALKMVRFNSNGYYFPQLNNERCNNCGLCLRVCPGHSVDFKTLNLDIFGRESEDILIGNYQSCHLGHATDDNIRYNAASGGVITALLIFALERGIIDGALVTRMKKDQPLKPEPFIARTRGEIIEASKSKYCPVPANVALKKILNSKKAKFAVVGLPCHIQGLRKAESVHKRLKEKIVLHLGIFCSHNDTFLQTESLLNNLCLRAQDIAKIDYRGEGWPGMMSILLKNARKLSLPFFEMISLHKLWFHALPRCALCCDLTSELADVSCGDPWLPEVMSNEKIGKSIVVCRTKIGKAICIEAVRDGYIEIEELDPNKVKQSGDMLKTKKRDIKVRFSLRRLFNKPTPVYNTVLLQPGPINCLRGVLVYLNVWISSKRYLRRFINPLSRIELGLLSLKKG